MHIMPHLKREASSSRAPGDAERPPLGVFAKEPVRTLAAHPTPSPAYSPAAQLFLPSPSDSLILSLSQSLVHPPHHPVNPRTMLHPHPPLPSPTPSSSDPPSSSSAPPPTPHLPPSLPPKINSPLTLPGVASAMESEEVITDLPTAVIVSTLAASEATAHDLEAGDVKVVQDVEDVTTKPPPAPTPLPESPSSSPLPPPEDDDPSAQSQRLSVGSRVMSSPATSRYSSRRSDPAPVPTSSEEDAPPPLDEPSPADEPAVVSPAADHDTPQSTEAATIAELDKVEEQAAAVAENTPSGHNEGDTAEVLAATEAAVSEEHDVTGGAQEDHWVSRVR